VIVGLGVDLGEYARLPERGAFRRTHPELANKLLVVFLGRVTPKKGLDILAPAFARVVAAVPEAHLLVAGPDDDGHGATIRDLISRLGIQDRVTWTGLITGQAKLELLRDADAWVLPSRDENFGVAVVEALAAGAPILITDGIGIHEMIQRHDAGLVVSAEPNAIADGLTLLLRDESLCRKLGANGRQLALTEFSWDIAAKRLKLEYERIVERDRLHRAASTHRRAA
jgi:glycosyltransferase involved in cell wall biosynthesis